MWNCAESAPGKAESPHYKRHFEPSESPDSARLWLFRRASQFNVPRSPAQYGRGSVTACCLLLAELLAAHTGLEPVISALRGQRVNQLHQCATRWTFGIIEAVATRRKLVCPNVLGVTFARKQPVLYSARNSDFI